ncbi:MAG: toxin-antitoxin system HicB family antitoxin [Deltaproteobacteria bacterium]|nr:MAG: toxin-antitoxin system HicB family antitoxin [Deltaproteobacteria bacterium]
MALQKDRYTYRVTWSEDDQEYIGLVAEFPSLSWLAKTQESALKGIRKVVYDIVDDMVANNETVPEPIAGKRYSGKFAVRTVPELHRSLAIQAAEAGVSLNRIVNLKLSH